MGPSLVVFSVTEAYNAEIFLNNPPSIVFFNGCVLFVVGLAVVRAHNIWVLRSPVLVTLVGWAALVLGGSRMVFPEQHVVKVTKGWQMYMVQGTVCFLGAALSVIGYR
jgi:hypothetical protein